MNNRTIHCLLTDPALTRLLTDAKKDVSCDEWRRLVRSRDAREDTGVRPRRRPRHKASTEGAVFSSACRRCENLLETTLLCRCRCAIAGFDWTHAVSVRSLWHRQCLRRSVALSSPLRETMVDQAQPIIKKIVAALDLANCNARVTKKSAEPLRAP